MIYRYPRALPPHFTELNFLEVYNRIWALNSLIVGIDTWMATQPDNPTAPGHSACLKGLLACIEVRPVSLSAENVGAGRSAEDNGTNHKRKAESLSIVFPPQKFLCEWAESLPIPPEGKVLSLILGCSAQCPSHCERCGRQDRLCHESWANTLSPDGQDLSWSQSPTLAADLLTAGRNLPLVTWPILEKVRPS